MSVFNVIHVISMVYMRFFGEHTNNFILPLLYSIVIDSFCELFRICVVCIGQKYCFYHRASVSSTLLRPPRMAQKNVKVHTCGLCSNAHRVKGRKAAFGCFLCKGFLKLSQVCQQLTGIIVPFSGILAQTPESYPYKLLRQLRSQLRYRRRRYLEDIVHRFRR